MMLETKYIHLSPVGAEAVKDHQHRGLIYELKRLLRAPKRKKTRRKKSKHNKQTRRRP